MIELFSECKFIQIKPKRSINVCFSPAPAQRLFPLNNAGISIRLPNHRVHALRCFPVCPISMHRMKHDGWRRVIDIECRLLDARLLLRWWSPNGWQSGKLTKTRERTAERCWVWAFLPGARYPTRPLLAHRNLSIPALTNQRLHAFVRVFVDFKLISISIDRNELVHWRFCSSPSPEQTRWVRWSTVFHSVSERSKVAQARRFLCHYSRSPSPKHPPTHRWLWGVRQRAKYLQR